MAVDRGYGTGTSRSASNSASRRNAARAANNRKRTIRRAGRKIGNTATAALKPLAGSSEYIVRENAARAQLGVSGQAARYRQLPKAMRATARGFVRELTGVDVSRNGIKVDPFSVAMAWTPAKFLKFAKVAGALRSASRASDEAFQAGRRMIGGAPMRQGNVVRNLNQGSQQVSRSFEGAFESVSDRASAADYGKEISRILKQNNLPSFPNNIAGFGRGGRDVYRPVRSAEISSRPGQALREAGFDVESMYPSGTPAGGYLKAPNLSTRRPYPVELTREGQDILTGGLTEAQRAAYDRVRALYNEAQVFRNLSAGMKPGGEYYFPRSYQPYLFARATPGSDMVPRVAGRLDPAEYKFKVANWILKQARQKRFLK